MQRAPQLLDQCTATAKQNVQLPASPLRGAQSASRSSEALPTVRDPWGLPAGSSPDQRPPPQWQWQHPGGAAGGRLLLSDAGHLIRFKVSVHLLVEAFYPSLSWCSSLSQDFILPCCQLRSLLPHCLLALTVRPALKVYQQKEWVLRSWRDVFVDLVQGQLQHLFLSLLSGLAPHGPSQHASVASSVCRHALP